MKVLFYFSFLLLIVIPACIQPLPTESVVAGNKNPEIKNIFVDPFYINVGTTTTITVEAEDPDGDALSYSWTATIGDIIGNGPVVKYTAAFCCVGSTHITVIVKDSHGAKTSDTIEIFVNP